MTQAPDNCLSCRLALQRSKVVQGEGKHNPTLMIVGDAPSREDDQSGRPFSGGTGKILSALLSDAGILRSDCYLTFATKCRCPNSRAPQLDELYACQGYLGAEINRVDPRVIVALGDTAGTLLTGKALGDWRGSIVDGIGPANNRKVLLTYEPQFVMKARTMFPVVAWDLRKASKPLVEYPNKTYLINPDRTTVEAWFNAHRNVPVACDIETTADKEDGGKKDALDPFKGEIIGLAFCANPGHALHLSAGAMLRDWDIIGSFLEGNNNIEWANNLFDRYFLFIKKGIRPGIRFDVQTLMHLIYSKMPKKLDFLRSAYTNEAPYKLHYKANYKSGVWSPQALGDLNCLDVDITRQVAKAQEPHVHPSLIASVWREEEIALDMKIRGVYIDQRVLASHYAQILPTIERLEKEFNSKYGVSISSPKQLNNLMYLTLKLPKHDDKGKPCVTGASTNEKAIQAIGNKLGLVYLNDEDGERFEGDHPNKDVIAHILEYRGLAKIAGTYCEGVFKSIQTDGRVHPGWKPTGTATGRWSCVDVPMQGVPKEMRDMVCAAPGKILMGADYKGMQIMGAGVLAKDWELCQLMLDPRYSIHNDVLEAIKPHYPSIKKIQAKTVVFGTFFGRSVRDIAMQFHVPVKTAELWQEIFYSLRPKLKQLFEVDSPAFWESHGYMLGGDGRKMHCEKITEAKNYPVQNFETVVTKEAMWRLREEGYHMLLNGHDQLVCEEPDDDTKYDRWLRFLDILEHARTDLYAHFPIAGGMDYRWSDLDTPCPECGEEMMHLQSGDWACSKCSGGATHDKMYPDPRRPR